MRQTIIASLALAAVVTIGASTANAGVTLCKTVSALCADPSPPGGGSGHSVPEPGTLGLLAVGAAAGWARLRKRLKK